MQTTNPVNWCGASRFSVGQLALFDRNRPFEKTAITGLGVADGLQAEVRMHDRLFLDAQPDAGGKDIIESLNADSLKVVTAIVEPSLAQAQPDDKFQFEWHGYLVADRVDHVQESKPVFNLDVGLKDGWGK